MKSDILISGIVNMQNLNEIESLCEGYVRQIILQKLSQ